MISDQEISNYIASFSPRENDIVRIQGTPESGGLDFSDERIMSHAFWINDLLFMVPPEAIAIQSENNFRSSQALRSDSTIKVPDGFGTEVFTCQFTIPSKSSIVNVDIRTRDTDRRTNTAKRGGLLDLILQFKNIPFARVENAVIRSKLRIPENKNIAVCMDQIAFSTSPGEPGTITAILNFTAFNYSPYSTDWSYRYDWVSAERFGGKRFDDVNVINLDNRVRYGVREFLKSDPEYDEILSPLVTQDGEAVDYNLSASEFEDAEWGSEAIFMEKPEKVLNPCESAVFKDYIDWIHYQHTQVPINDRGDVLDCTKMSPYGSDVFNLGDSVKLRWKEFRKFRIPENLENRIRQRAREQIRSILSQVQTTSVTDPSLRDFNEQDRGRFSGVVDPMNNVRYNPERTPRFGQLRSTGLRHEGVDLVSGSGDDLGLYSPVYSMVSGKVIEATEVDNMDYVTESFVRARKTYPGSVYAEGYGTNNRVYGFNTESTSGRRANVVRIEVMDNGPLHGHVFCYLHLASPLKVSQGQYVTAGQEIARMGSSDIEDTNPHLHLEIWKSRGSNRVATEDGGRNGEDIAQKLDPGYLLFPGESNPFAEELNEFYKQNNIDGSYQSLNIVSNAQIQNIDRDNELRGEIFLEALASSPLYANWVAEVESTGWKQYREDLNTFDVFYRDHEYIIPANSSAFPMDSSPIVCDFISMSLQNLFKGIPLLGSTIPTAQFLGKTDDSLMLSFKSIGLNHIKILSNMIDMLRKQAIVFKTIKEAWCLYIENPLINASGKAYFIVLAPDLTTLKGSPGVYGCELRLLSTDIKSNDLRISYLGQINEGEVKRTFIRELFGESLGNMLVTNIFNIAIDSDNQRFWWPSNEIYGINIQPQTNEEVEFSKNRMSGYTFYSERNRGATGVPRNGILYNFLRRLALGINSANMLFYHESILDGIGASYNPDKVFFSEFGPELSRTLFYRNKKTGILGDAEYGRLQIENHLRPENFYLRRENLSEVGTEENIRANYFNYFKRPNEVFSRSLPTFDNRISGRLSFIDTSNSRLRSDADYAIIDERLDEAFSSQSFYYDSYLRLTPQIRAYLDSLNFLVYLVTSSRNSPSGLSPIPNGEYENPVYARRDLPVLTRTYFEDDSSFFRSREFEQTIGYARSFYQSFVSLFYAPPLFADRYGQPFNLSPEIPLSRNLLGITERRLKPEIYDIVADYFQRENRNLLDSYDSFEDALWQNVGLHMIYNSVTMEDVRSLSGLRTSDGRNVFPKTLRMLNEERVRSTGPALPDLKLPLNPYWNYQNMDIGSIYTDADFYLWSAGIDGEEETPKVETERGTPDQAYSRLTQTEVELSMLSLSRWDPTNPEWVNNTENTFSSEIIGGTIGHAEDSAGFTFAHPVDSIYLPSTPNEANPGGLASNTGLVSSSGSGLISDSGLRDNESTNNQMVVLLEEESRLIASGYNQENLINPYTEENDIDEDLEPTLEDIVASNTTTTNQGPATINFSEILPYFGPNLNLPQLESVESSSWMRRLDRETFDNSDYMTVLKNINQVDVINARTFSYDFSVENRDAVNNPGYSELQQFSNTRSALYQKVRDGLKSLGRKKWIPRRAFPALKIFFIEEDSTDKQWIQYDDMYTYNQVESISISDSRKRAASVCEIVFYNIGGVLDSNTELSALVNSVNTSSIRALDYEIDLNSESEIDQLQDTEREQNAVRFALQEGTKIKVKLGYSNNADRLEEMFLGEVAEVEYLESSNKIRVVAQSYGTELVASPKGSTKAQITKEYINTFSLLAHMMFEPEVLHFGRKKMNSIDVYGEDQSIRRNEIIHRLTIGFTPWKDWGRPIGRRISGVAGFVTGAPLRRGINYYIDRSMNQLRIEPLAGPQDDNIYAPNYSEGQRKVWYRWFSGGRYGSETIDGELRYFERYHPNELKYNIFYSSIWDIFDEMTLRHPGYVKHARLYKNSNRMTMFFGLPDQRYWASDASETDAVRQNSLFMRLAREGSISLESEDMRAWLGFIKRRFVPFREWHHINSTVDIIQNNIVANKYGFYTVASVQYMKGGTGRLRRALRRLENAAQINEEALLDPNSFVNFRDAHVEQMMAHRDLSTENVRQQFFTFPGCRSRFIAKKYAQALLARSAKEMYKGSIMIIGNNKIKPYDVIFLNDTYNDISGPLEVEEVIHVFSPQTGYITEIIPDTFIINEDVTPFILHEGLKITAALKTELYMENAIFTPDYNLRREAALNQITTALRDEAIAGVEEVDRIRDLFREISSGFALGGAGTAGAFGVLAGAAAAGAATAGAAVVAAAGTFGLLGASMLVYAKMTPFIVNSVARQKAYIMVPLVRKGSPWLAGYNMTPTNSFLRSSFDLLTRWVRNAQEGASLAEADVISTNRRIREANGSELTLFSRYLLFKDTLGPGIRRALVDITSSGLDAAGIDPNVQLDEFDTNP